MNNKKNIIVFMYNFPPIGAGRGIAWTYFAKELAIDYNVRIITIDPSESDPMYNNSKLNLVGESYKIHRTNPGKFYRFLYPKKKSVVKSKAIKTKSNKYKIKKILSSLYKNIIRATIFPDRMIFWNKHAYREFIKINENNPTDIIVTVGFPFSTHLLGMKIKRKFGCRLILDYGDPWSFNPSNETIPKWRSRLDYFFEKKVINHSDYITVTTDSTCSQYKKIYNLSNKIKVIRQGVDLVKYNSVFNQNTDKKRKTNIIKLFYSGIFYYDIRNPKQFFRALSLIDFNRITDLTIDITIAGKMEQYVLDYVNKLSFSKNLIINFIGNIPFEDVIRLQIECDSLLYFGNEGDLQVPGKLYEYIAARRPIFAIAPVFDESCEIITKNNRGFVVENDAFKIKEEFIRFLNSIIDNSSTFNLNEVQDFDWGKIGKQYKEIIDKFV
ncbi:glycosyltransferase [Paraliobacillus sp. JSM ZJ581]|uniref:glycosyltransferase n=1 Tax=Paraliobacillus sp. JSM ZJ581 TaxID=3342118 RepID=UPI0035A95803